MEEALYKMEKAFDKMCKLALFEFVALVVFAAIIFDFGHQKEQLQRQLEQAQQQLADAKQLAGKPINIVDLPKAEYIRTNTKVALVRRVIDDGFGVTGPEIAVYSADGVIPDLFNPKNIGKDASDF